MTTALFVAALGLIAFGVGLIYVPAGIIAAGAGLALVANLIDASTVGDEENAQ